MKGVGEGNLTETAKSEVLNKEQDGGSCSCGCCGSLVGIWLGLEPDNLELRRRSIAALTCTLWVNHSSKQRDSHTHRHYGNLRRSLFDGPPFARSRHRMY